MTLRFNMMIEMPVNLGGCRKIRLSRQEHRATKHLQTRPTSLANAMGELLGSVAAGTRFGARSIAAGKALGELSE